MNPDVVFVLLAALFGLVVVSLRREDELHHGYYAVILYVLLATHELPNWTWASYHGAAFTTYTLAWWWLLDDFLQHLVQLVQTLAHVHVWSDWTPWHWFGVYLIKAWLWVKAHRHGQ